MGSDVKDWVQRMAPPSRRPVSPLREEPVLSDSDTSSYGCFEDPLRAVPLDAHVRDRVWLGADAACRDVVRAVLTGRAHSDAEGHSEGEGSDASDSDGDAGSGGDDDDEVDEVARVFAEHTAQLRAGPAAAPATPSAPRAISAEEIAQQTRDHDFSGRWSALSRTEHRLYRELSAKPLRRRTAVETRLVDALRLHVEREQLEFAAHVRRVVGVRASAQRESTYVRNTMADWVRRELARVKTLPQHVRVADSMDLRTPPAQQPPIALRSHGGVHECGHMLDFLPPGSGATIPSNFSFCPPPGSTRSAVHWTLPTPRAVADDDVAWRLACEHGADAVLDEGAFLALTDVRSEAPHTFAAAFRLPAAVRRRPDDQRTVLCIDAPLPPPLMSTRARGEFVMRTTLRGVGLQVGKRTPAGEGGDGSEWLEHNHVRYVRCEVGDFCVLVRTGVDGLLASADGATPCTVLAQLDYVPEVGLTPLTDAQRRRVGALLFLLGAAHRIFLAHVHAADSRVLHTRVLTHDAPHAPRPAVGAMHRMLLWLRQAAAARADGAPMLVEFSPRSGAAEVRVAAPDASGGGGREDVHMRLGSLALPDDSVDALYVRPEWHERSGQVPFLFPFKPHAPKRKARGDEFVVYQGIDYCHLFAKRGMCHHGDACPYPHRTADEVDTYSRHLGLATKPLPADPTRKRGSKRGGKRKRAKKKKKKKTSDSQP